MLPGSIVFARDMLLPIPVIANFEALRNHHQVMVDDNRHRQNLHRQFHDYAVGDEVLIVNWDKNKPKLAPISTGPFAVWQVHANGTLTIVRGPNLYERINIRRLRPYHRQA